MWNPSSGNLHPTESYLIAGPIAGLQSSPGVYHYAPKSHSLELLAKMEGESWQALHLPEGSLLLAFSSIYWRESWKYGERAFRYSMLDVWAMPWQQWLWPRTVWAGRRR